jgi:uncharacterized protein (DUF58 family)
MNSAGQTVKATDPESPIRRTWYWVWEDWPDISFTGFIYIATTTLMGFAAVNSQANLLFAVSGLMFGVLLISGVICRKVLRQLRVTRMLPEFCNVGRPTTLFYEFKNQKKFWPSLSVALSETDGVEAFERAPSAYMLHAAAGMSANVPVEVIPKRRGRYKLGRYQLRTSFPFGFVIRTLSKNEPDAILVAPAIGRVSDQLLELCRSSERADAPMKPHRGGQDEFYGVKEHRAGENPRLIHWRRSARTPGVLVSKEMTQVAPPRLMLLADTFIQQAIPKEQAAVEKSLAMAASLADRALENGLAVGLCAWGGQNWVTLPPLQGKRHRRDILAALAGLPSNTVADSAALLEAAGSQIKAGTAAVLFTPRPWAANLSQEATGAIVVVPAASTAADAWFRFDAKLNFERCIAMG